MNFSLKKLLKTENYTDLARHLGIMILLGTILFIFTFYALLPVITKHGESITVPDIIGLSYEDLEEFLTERNLRFEVNVDSGYSAEFPPLTVLKQYPEGGQKVKENRKIFITLNAQNPPNVRMPKLVEGSVKNAEIILESYGLVRGNISYRPDAVANSVLMQLYKGKPIPAGALISKGSQIDLIIGDGFGKRIFEMPELIGMQLDEARVMILGSGLQMGEINYAPSPGSLPGKVISQKPSPGEMVRIETRVDLWVTEESQEEK